MLRAGAVAVFLALAATAPASAAPPGRYRLTSSQGTGNEVTITIGVDGRTVENTNSFVYDEGGNPYCVWGGSLRGAPSNEDAPAPLGDDGSFRWHAHEDVFDDSADTTGAIAADGSAEADVTITGCEDLNPFDIPPLPPFATVHFTGGPVAGGGGPVAGGGGSPPPPAGSLPLLDPQPPIAPGQSPTPGHGYPSPPAPGSDCTAEVKAGDLDGVATCWKLRGDVYSTGDRARVNGIDLTPASPGAQIRIDKRTQMISTTGPVEVRVGPMLLLRAKFTWRSHEQVFSAKGQHFLGLPVKGGAELALEGGRTKLTLSVGVPDDPLIRRLIPLEKLSGDLTVAATNAAGIVLDEAKVTFPSIRVAFVEVDDAELAVTRPTARAYHYDGRATVYGFARASLGIGGIFGMGAGDGYLKAGLFAEALNKPLWAAIFLQRIGLTLQFNPFGWTGSAGVTAGPEFRLGGNQISTLRLDGALAYLSGNGGEPSSLELAGSAKAMGEVDLGDGRIKVSGGRVDVEGRCQVQARQVRDRREDERLGHRPRAGTSRAASTCPCRGPTAAARASSPPAGWPLAGAASGPTSASATRTGRGSAGSTSWRARATSGPGGNWPAPPPPGWGRAR
jgi:hypothetical protein